MHIPEKTFLDFLDLWRGDARADTASWQSGKYEENTQSYLGSARMRAEKDIPYCRDFYDCFHTFQCISE